MDLILDVPSVLLCLGFLILNRFDSFLEAMKLSVWQPIQGPVVALAGDLCCCCRHPILTANWRISLGGTSLEAVDPTFHPNPDLNPKPTFEPNPIPNLPKTNLKPPKPYFTTQTQAHFLAQNLVQSCRQS